MLTKTHTSEKITHYGRIPINQQKTVNTPACIHKIIHFDPANAVKVALDRPVASGRPDDTGVYGAQQHAPILRLAFEL